MNWDGLLDILTDTVTDLFARPVSYQRTLTGETFDEVRGIYDPSYLLQEAGAKLGVGTRVQTLDIKDEDIGGPALPGDFVVMDGVRYEITTIHPSTSGMTMAQLRRRGK